MGRSIRSLDAKGRLVLTPPFKDVLLDRSSEGRVVLTTYDNCVVGYPLPDWETVAEKFNSMTTSSQLLRDFRRLVIGGAEEVKVDANGRVQVPQAHREYAGLNKDIMLVGVGRTFEVWDQERFAARTEQKKFDERKEELGEVGALLL